jgi:hypothetical protein
VTNSVVGFLFTEFNDNVRSQLVRDLMILKGTWDFAVSDPEAMLTDDFLSKLDLVRTQEKPTLLLVYKTTKDWPKFPYSIPTVKRDLEPSSAEIMLDPNPHVGYYLKDQGRDGANRTEQYLNRMHPSGKGIINPMVQMIWGNKAPAKD